MSDIQLRFNKDMLVIASPLDAALLNQGANPLIDRQMFNLIEQDTLSRLVKNDIVAGAQCVVTTTEDITSARLSHINRENEAKELAKRAIDIAKEGKPQHILFEIGPCGLPLDPHSRLSLNENKTQYKNAASLVSPESVDAIFLNGFVSIDDLKCALMGVSQSCDMPVIASVTISKDALDDQNNLASTMRVGKTGVSSASSSGTSKGIAEYFLKDSATINEEIIPPAPVSWSRCMDAHKWGEAVAVMSEFGASVIGFETPDSLANAEKYAIQAREECNLPLLAQLRVTKNKQSHTELIPLEDRIDYAPEVLELAALQLREKGVQFLRASGLARSVHTAALASSVQGLDVVSL